MQSITLQNIPNQELIVTIDGYRYSIPIKSANGFMTYGITRDGVVIVENGNRLVNGAPLFLYKYMETGNFILTVPDDELPDYKQFQSTQFLKYASKEELGLVR